MPREELRALLFPGGRFRLAEELDTPLGRSGFICLPLFADELAGTVTWPREPPKPSSTPPRSARGRSRWPG